MSRLSLPLGVCGTVLAAAFLAASTPAHATFPGANGRIAFDSNLSGNYDVWPVNPHGGPPTQLTTDSGGKNIQQLTNDGGNDLQPNGRRMELTSRSRTRMRRPTSPTNRSTPSVQTEPDRST